MKATNEERSSLLTIKQVAQILCVCRRTLEREIQRGRLARPLKIGKGSRWSNQDVDTYLALLASERQAQSAKQSEEQEYNRDMARLERERKAVIRSSEQMARERQQMQEEHAKLSAARAEHEKLQAENDAFEARHQEIQRRLAEYRLRRQPDASA